MQAHCFLQQATAHKTDSYLDARPRAAVSAGSEASWPACAAAAACQTLQGPLPDSQKL
jgi:hypothetical protein